mgnify:FL=1
MGELLFCHEPIAALPYYVEGIGINLYSMEELCYYIMGNTYLLDNSFMSEELCTWVEKQMGLYKLAEKLRDIMRGQGLLSEFVLAILEQNGYCTMKEMQDIVLTIRQMEEKSDFECNKIRADHLMEKQKYLAGIYEYKRLLDSPDAKEASALLRGNIWHNLGTAYARLFLFEEAAKCYEEAYKRNESRESLRECLLCYRCLHDENGFMRKAIEHNIDETGMQEIRNELSLASRSEDLEQFEEHLEKLAEASEGSAKLQAKKEIGDIIFRWKEEYRKSCRV